MMNIEKNYRKMISNNDHHKAIRQILEDQISFAKSAYSILIYYAVELRKEEENISCYILEIYCTKNTINEYRTTKKFFQSNYERGLLQLVGSYGIKSNHQKYRIFGATNVENFIPFILQEIKAKTKPTKKQIGVLTKTYGKLIYENARNSQFYIIPSLKERTRVKRYTHVHKNTVNSLIKKGLISKKLGQVYLLTSRAKCMLEKQAIKELSENQLRYSIREWIDIPKLMQEYIIRMKGGKK